MGGDTPTVTPDTVFRNAVRLPRDYYVRVFSNDYSVDPSFIGRIVDVTANLDTVTVTHDGVLIATHVRICAGHLVVTDPAHLAWAAVMRRDFRTQRVHRPNPWKRCGSGPGRLRRDLRHRPRPAAGRTPEGGVMKPPAASPAAFGTSPTIDSDAYSPPAATAPAEEHPQPCLNAKGHAGLLLPRPGPPAQLSCLLGRKSEFRRPL
ncbi:Mu transposase domain-containing protein [Arthrobacter sp. TB 26]|uniref:Mu transposase domain-containing protein n=1 Tax=Arthrobacter sp. TB 26 TaxID=494420 RepID=UPI003A5C514E